MQKENNRCSKRKYRNLKQSSKEDLFRWINVNYSIGMDLGERRCSNASFCLELISQLDVHLNALANIDCFFLLSLCSYLVVFLSLNNFVSTDYKCHFV